MTFTNRTGLPSKIASRLRLPLVAAPMLRVSGVNLVTAVCRSGAIGAFPTANAGSVEELDHWLRAIEHGVADLGHQAAPHCPNLIVHQWRFQEDLACLVRHKVEMVITSVGSPAAAVGPLHDVGCLVFADIASLNHAEKAIKAGGGWADPVECRRGWPNGPGKSICLGSGGSRDLRRPSSLSLSTGLRFRIAPCQRSPQSGHSMATVQQIPEWAKLFAFMQSAQEWLGQTLPTATFWNTELRSET